MKNSELIKQLKALKEDVSRQTQMDKRVYDRMQNIAGIVSESEYGEDSPVEESEEESGSRRGAAKLPAQSVREPWRIKMDTLGIGNFISRLIFKGDSEQSIEKAVRTVAAKHKLPDDQIQSIVDHAKKMSRLSKDPKYSPQALHAPRNPQN
ncbi:MAG: hypothetical protein EBZ49_15435 [Proteobacteria bacterium]|nr:hypothetical protein [Pseudomonadota bacterium]